MCHYFSSSTITFQMFKHKLVEIKKRQNHEREFSIMSKHCYYSLLKCITKTLLLVWEILISRRQHLVDTLITFDIIYVIQKCWVNQTIWKIKGWISYELLHCRLFVVLSVLQVGQSGCAGRAMVASSSTKVLYEKEQNSIHELSGLWLLFQKVLVGPANIT